MKYCLIKSLPSKTYWGVFIQESPEIWRRLYHNNDTWNQFLECITSKRIDEIAEMSSLFTVSFSDDINDFFVDLL